MKRALILILFLAAIYVFGNPYITNILVVCAVYALPAIGLSLLMSYTGQLSLGHSAFVGIGAYASTIISTSLNLNPWICICIATVISSLSAWLVGWIVFRLKGHHLAMATLSFALIIHTVLIEWRAITGGPDGIGGIPPLSIGSIDFVSDNMFYILAWLVCIVVLILSEKLVKSPAGIAMRTVGENENVAYSLGINAQKIKRNVMALSGAFAGLSGAMYAHWLGYISPDPFSVSFSIKLLLIVALGGVAGVWNVLFGVFVVVIVSELLKPFGRLDVVIYGLLLVFVMVWCRKGIVAEIVGIFRQFRHHHQTSINKKS